MSPAGGHIRLKFSLQYPPNCQPFHHHCTCDCIHKSFSWIFQFSSFHRSPEAEMTVFQLFRFSVFLFVLKTYETKQTQGKSGKKNVVLCQPNHHQAGKWEPRFLNILSYNCQNNTSIQGIKETSLIFFLLFFVVFCQSIIFSCSPTAVVLYGNEGSGQSDAEKETVSNMCS